MKDTEKTFTIVSVTGTRATTTQDPDTQASQKMRGMGFISSHGAADSPHLHKDAKPEQGRNIHLIFEGEGAKGKFRLMDGDTVLDEGEVYDVTSPTPSIRTTTLFTSTGKKSGLGYEFCCLPKDGNGTPGSHGNGTPGDNRESAPTPRPSFPPPPIPDPLPNNEGSNAPPPSQEQTTKPKKPRERKEKSIHMQKPTATTNRLLDLKQKMDEGNASDADIAAVVIKEMDGAEHRHRTEKLEEIMRALDKSKPWVYRYYRLRDLVPQLISRINEMGMVNAAKLASVPQSAQEDIFQHAMEERMPRKRTKLLKRLCREAKASAPPNEPAKQEREKVRRGKVHREENGEEGIAAINRLIQTLGEVDMNGDITPDAFRAFASEQTPGNMQKILEKGEMVQNAIEKLLGAYREVSAPLLKSKH